MKKLIKVTDSNWKHYYVYCDSIHQAIQKVEQLTQSVNENQPILNADGDLNTSYVPITIKRAEIEADEVIF